MQKSQTSYVNWNLFFLAFFAVAFGIGNILGIYVQAYSIEYDLAQMHINTQMESNLIFT